MGHLHYAGGRSDFVLGYPCTTGTGMELADRPAQLPVPVYPWARTIHRITFVRRPIKVAGVLTLFGFSVNEAQLQKKGSQASREL